MLQEDVCVVAPPTPSTASVLKTGEPVLLELHIVFHATYQTPALFFRAATVDGTPVNPQRVLRDVRFAGRGDRSLVVASMEQHPVLGTPFALLHPCETAAAMELLLRQATLHREPSAGDPNSNKDASDRVPAYLASWLSLVQPLTGISPLDYYAVR